MKNNKLIKTLTMSATVLFLYVLNTLAVSPVISNIVLRSSISNAHIIEILLYLSGLLPVIATFVGYAFIIYEITFDSVRGSFSLLIGYQTVCFVALVFSLIMGYVNAGSLPSGDEFTYNMLTLLLNFILIAVMMYAVVYATHLIKKKTESPTRIMLMATLAAAIFEGIKQLVIELTYIIPFLLDYAPDISGDEVISMLISLLWAIMVFAVGYAVTHFALKILNNRKTAA